MIAPRSDVDVVDQYTCKTWARLIYSDGLIAWLFWVTDANGDRHQFASVCVEVLALSEITARAGVARSLRIYRAAQHRHSKTVGTSHVRTPLEPVVAAAADLPSDYPKPVVQPERRRVRKRDRWQHDL